MFPFGFGIIPALIFYYPAILKTHRPWVGLQKLSKHFGDFFMCEIGGYLASK